MSVRETLRYVMSRNIEDMKKDIVSDVMLKKIIKPIIKKDGTVQDLQVYFHISNKGDHIIIPYVFCSCKNFLIKVMVKKEKKSCKHLLMLRLALSRSKFRILALKDINELKKIVDEINKIGISPTLRKLLYARKTSN